ncbi:Holliday junction branch migration protein RuvA [Arthrobacter sp. AL08]|uniref:Holliday junction branch migration protein RuvA n=1 Tax=Micrococcaceae TaxID=1268 RepID=UPI001CFFD38E|nr:MULTISPECIES: Holliday junction branch migration protein RuvA [Micrococcaceae]MCB5282495.1 Holliday junction ATP-dependent DNA helicase RuvA [Arthrobacter sp. ES1]MDI3242823.1 Holliday junction branch migration protein RuvA [Arthrobacter sp. AL05]MDI3278914.1 Holliday junction branch migration protein RuvA [Arthrobacter sp. AL08]MDJ0351593.1 Holliday junction branch migration protein RuvA [Pseudarthrobacter sp. PH31-O2]WGZ78049.1 Holliday junction branch migration protein RuvA [Arthrobacter
MISFLRGTVAHVGLSSAVIDLNGAGMSVNATPQTLSRLRAGEEGKLFTSLIVREDSLTLFGFASDDERAVFDILLSVSGVGPRLALAVLAVHEPETIRVAAHSGDGKAFTKVPGIGPKVAGRIVLELAGKLVPHGTAADAPAPAASSESVWKPQVVAAMTSLGWSEKDATSSIDKSLADSPELADRGNVAEILRATLRWLGQDGARAGNRAGARG